LSFVLYYIIPYRKKVVFDNLALAFPEKTEQERRRIAKDFYTNFTDLIVEAIKAMSISYEELSQRAVIPKENEAMIRDLVEVRKQSIIVLATHHFNWEWVSMAASRHFHVLLRPVYKKLNNAAFDALIYNMRSRFGASPVEMKQTYRIIQEPFEDKPRAWVIVADQTPSRSQKKYFTHFFERQTPFFMGTATLPPLVNYPAYFIHIKKIKRGYYEYTFEKVAEPPYGQTPDFSIIDSYAKAVERAVREQPETWLWSHRRWKHSKPLSNE
ncbi:MAG: lysophospholipid acyltransferase family protein, partial [Bernardetiaceae bacterium]|nr:lysophospholipid acyltransferase family protein [Bernardetiaceae bacterium]